MPMLISCAQIADTLRRFGISDKTTSLLAIKITDTSTSSSSAPSHASSQPPTRSTPTNPEITPSDPSSSSPTTPSQQPHPHQTPLQIQNFLTANITGTPLPFTTASLNQLGDIALIRKLYKLPAPTAPPGSKRGDKGSSAGNGHAGDQNADEQEKKQRIELEIQVLGIMALKGS